MKIHEYQAKAILKKFGVEVPRGHLAETAADAKKIAGEFGGTVVVKAQIHAGGRGKGGGVKIAKNAEEAEAFAAEMIGMNLVTHQTGPAGREVRKVLIEEGLDIDRELYLGIVLDRAKSQLVFGKDFKRAHRSGGTITAVSSEKVGVRFRVARRPGEKCFKVF